MDYTQQPFLISDDPAKLDIAVIHGYLSNDSYWATGRPLEVMQRAIAGSLNFGVYDTSSKAQIGFARVITDYATFGYLADVFILHHYRGQGLSKWLMACILAHPRLQGIGLMLQTADAQGLYQQFGFEVAPPERVMIRKKAPQSVNE
jgi:GNAT superfamily N-acetyltransferase